MSWSLTISYQGEEKEGEASFAGVACITNASKGFGGTFLVAVLCFSKSIPLHGRDQSA